jgi:predicted Zn-dependent protease
MAQRIVLALVAVLAAAWLAVSYRDARLQARAAELTDVPEAQLDAGTVREADDLLRRARFINPDRTLDFQRGVLMMRAGRFELAVDRIEGYLRDEPENREAWAFLWGASARTDPALARRALRRFRELGSVGDG